MTKQHSQSGEPSGQVKNEELKSFSHEEYERSESKKAGHIKGGDNASMSDEDWDEYEKQQAGGTHKGGKVQGAHGKESPDQNQNLSEGM